MEEKTRLVADNSARLGLKVNRGKRKALKNNAAVSTSPIKLDEDGLEDVTSSIYLSSTADKKKVGGGG